MNGDTQVAIRADGVQRRRSRAHVSASLLIKIASVCCFVLAWQLATTTGVISPLFLPSPGQIVAQAQELIASGDLDRKSVV